MFQNLLEALKVRKAGAGVSRTRPDRAMDDKTYTSKAICQYLRDRGIQCVIPDQKANRKRKAPVGGRPVTYDKDAYKRRKVVECSLNALKQWRSWPPATTSLP